MFEPAPGIVLHLPLLWVDLAQRGGRRTGHRGQLARVGQQLIFRPTYDFQPGEVIYATTWAAQAANQAARPQLWQFTAVAGGTGQGNFGLGTDLPAPTLAPGLALSDVDGDLDLVTGSDGDGARAREWRRCVGLEYRPLRRGLGNSPGRLHYPLSLRRRCRR